MRLGLSSDAARGAAAEDLVATCRQRGLGALEITFREGPRPADVAALLAASGSDFLFAGVLHDGPPADAIFPAAAEARGLGVPMILGGGSPLDERMEIARAIIEDEGAARVLTRGPAAEWLDSVLDSGVPFAWQIDDASVDPAADAELILSRTDIGYVRLVGGGPENALQEGRGVGGVMRQLALAGCTAPLILTPSSQRYRLAWSAWLGRRGGWGCGSAAEGRTRTIPLGT